jgi:transposase-like protein
VVRYTEEFVHRWEPFELGIGRSWRADETSTKVKGGWVYLYRAEDEKGKMVASYLSRNRDLAAARIFFRRALQRHGQPRTITLDGFEPSHSALRRMGMRNEFNFRGANPVKIRSCQELKQHRGTGSSPCEVPRFSDVGLQDVPACSPRPGRS